MKNILRKSHIQHLINNRNGYLTLAALSIVSNVLMLLYLFYSKGYERMVVVPPTIEKSFWVSENQVSAAYLSEMALFFINMRFTLTPANAASQRDILLRYVDPQNYETLKTALLAEADHLNKEHITTTFYQVDVKVDPKKLVARVVGDLLSVVGETRLPAQRMIYQIAFTYHGGRLLVKSFEEVKEDA